MKIDQTTSEFFFGLNMYSTTYLPYFNPTLYGLMLMGISCVNSFTPEKAERESFRVLFFFNISFFII